ncbi:hypothetical protein CRYUN_Cryun24cG0063000 [Craigia yunnanensis]
MSLHVLVVLHCNLGQYNEAIPVFERSIKILVIEDGQTHALAKFVGCMQLGDIYAMLDQIENSILCYTAAIDRRLMGLICDSKGDYESALEHYVLASMAMATNSHELDVASIDCNIRDAYLSLARFDEVVFPY